MNLSIDRKKIAIEKKEAEVKYIKELQRNKFKKIDTNRNFELSVDEILNFYQGQKSKKTSKTVNGRLSFYAYNDGKITSEEFLNDPDWKLGWARIEEYEVSAEYRSVENVN